MSASNTRRFTTYSEQVPVASIIRPSSWCVAFSSYMNCLPCNKLWKIKSFQLIAALDFSRERKLFSQQFSRHSQESENQQSQKRFGFYSNWWMPSKIDAPLIDVPSISLTNLCVDWPTNGDRQCRGHVRREQTYPVDRRVNATVYSSTSLFHPGAAIFFNRLQNINPYWFNGLSWDKGSGNGFTRLFSSWFVSQDTSHRVQT